MMTPEAKQTALALAIALSENTSQDAVEDSNELQRILALPRRSLDFADAYTEALTEVLRTPHGEQVLRPIQTLALHDLHQYGGLFGPIRVGGGKTLISYLAPTILEAKRPLLLIPAKLRDKTRREFRKLAYHWFGRHPDAYRIESYELLGRPQAAELLNRYQPDLLVLDEAHKAKNSKAAVTRRLKRYLAAHPECHVIALSGTMTKRSLRDYAHIVHWCLPKCSPVPTHYVDLEQWSDCLDEKVQPFRRLRPGALLQLCNEEEKTQSRYGLSEQLSAVRQAYRRRLVETPGIVATSEGPMDMSLSLLALEPKERDPQIEAHFQTLRTLWETPDGQPIADGITMWRHARELGLGFYYRWNPPAPDEWLERRKQWAKFCREKLKNNRRGFDSEAQVAMACDRGEYPDYFLRRWREIKSTFTPNTEAVWFSNEASHTVLDWLKHNDGIVWVEHVQFAERLSRLSGLPYYGKQGRNAEGRAIEDHPPGTSLIASVASNLEGRNLQAWCNNLIICAPPSGALWEQLLGRTHRDGQEADEVTCHLFLGCFEHALGFHQARKDAKYIQDTQGQAQKLLYADIDIPELEVIQSRSGFRWVK